MARVRLPRSPARISDDVARQVFRRLREDGTLEVVLNVLRDHRDTLAVRIQNAWGAELLVSKVALARCWARQGALDEVSRVIATLEALGMEQIETERQGRSG